MWGDNNDDEMSSFRRKFGGSGFPSQNQMVREIIEAVENLKSENARLKSAQTDLKDSLRIANNDRQQLIKQIEEQKTKFGSSVEAKYAKAMGALFAIANSVSEQSSKIIANGVIDELGERKQNKG